MTTYRVCLNNKTLVATFFTFYCRADYWEEKIQSIGPNYSAGGWEKTTENTHSTSLKYS